MCERSIGCPLTPPQPNWPTTGNRTGDLLVPRPVLNPLSHTSQGCLLILERQEGREKERERNIDVREIH